MHRDETAILETEKKYGAYCYRIAYNILRINQDSEECVNDMYNKAWNSIPPQTPKRLGAWLGKVIRNIAINLWNKNHRQKRYNGLKIILDELTECIPDAKLIEEEIEGIELTRFLDKWLDSLPKEDRVLFMRRYWNGEALKKLENEYNMSHGKMAKQMYQLRGNLKSALEKEGYNL
jgi:RNA polymerase sigma-70 factor (ECF subfamily)